MRRAFDPTFLAPVWSTYRADIARLAILVGLIATIVIAAHSTTSILSFLVTVGIGIGVSLLIPVTRRRPALLAAVVIMVPLGLIGLESVFRLRYFGTDAIVHFTRYAPNIPISNTGELGYMRVADDPDIGLELRPNFEGWSKGAPVAVNSFGYRERAFSTEKPPGVVRILVFGDSVAMGAGVEQDQQLTDFAETMLNESAPPGVTYQVLNLAVGGDMLERAGARLLRDTERFDGDVAILAFAAYRAGETVEDRVDWAEKFKSDQARANAESPIARYSFVRAIVPRLTIGGFIKRFTHSRRVLRNEAPPFTLPIVLENLSQFQRRTGTPVGVMVLRKLEFAADAGIYQTITASVTAGDPQRLRDHDRVRDAASDAGVPFIDTRDAFPPDARKSEYIIYPGDGHPNAAGHLAYARALVEALRDPDLTLLPPPR